MQLTSLDQLEAQTEEIEDRIAVALKPAPEVRLLRSIPRIGEILAPLVWLEIGDIHRFPRAENLAGYAGLVSRIPSVFITLPAFATLPDTRRGAAFCTLT